MGLSKLTDEQLVELANKVSDQDCEEEIFDVKHYQECFNIKSGNTSVAVSHLYQHYKKWSINAVEVKQFLDLLNLENKRSDFVFLDKEHCIIDLSKIIGNYVKKQRQKQKEKRFAKVSGSASKTKCED